MRHANFYLFIFLTFSLTSLFAANKAAEEQYKSIENNLLIGLADQNQGLKISCAYFLGEIKSEKAVIPLMRILKSSSAPEERLVAALALSKIKSSVGMFAIKQRIKFDDNERVKRICKIFYNEYKLKQIQGNIIVEPFEIADLNLEYKGIKLHQFIN